MWACPRQAANFLDVKDLLDLTCKTVAEYIKQCKTPEEIRQRFNIPNDFTPEEVTTLRHSLWKDRQCTRFPASVVHKTPLA